MMKKLLFFVFLAVCTIDGYGQQLWKNIRSEELIQGERLQRDSQPTEFKLFSLDLDALKATLATAPSRLQTQQSNVIVAFPNAQGQLQKFRIFEASVLHPDLAARHPEIQSYVGKGIDDPSATIRLSTTLFGLHTMTFSGADGVTYIDPYTKDQKNYIVYSRASLTTNKTFACGTVDGPEGMIEEITPDTELLRSNTSVFMTYRLAMSCTIEYAAFHVNAAGMGSGTLAQKKTAVLNAMSVTVARINSVYEHDLAVTLVLIPNNEDLIFITSDNFDNENTNNALLNQSQTVIDQVVGFDSYDIGHTVSTGGGGVAQRPSVCSSGKARGITGLPSPVGDPYDIDFVAHEMGHQFGGSHTFNSDQGNCAPPNRMGTSSFEPGSGTTIMGYAGICAPHDVQPHSDAYFHARSLIEIQGVLNGSGNCAATVPNNNTPPVVSAGGDFTIPYGTPFALTASATDADGDVLTYCWEQYNQQISTQPPVATSTVGPNFRSFPPSSSPKRYFPVFSSVLANNLAPTWEVVPNVARTMNFSVVVRDNGSPLGSQTERATMLLTFANTGPFKVTSQNSVVSWSQNSSQTVTWDVAGTTANNINTALVNIRLSTDGGATFPYLLAENTPNDGSESITVPNVTSSQTCRLMVEAVGNVFYALNTTNFLIGYEIVNTCTTYENNTAFALPDNSSAYTTRTINVPTAGVISDVNVHFNITHPNIHDLNLAVIRPGGGLLTVYNQQCASGANVDVTFDSEAAAFACGSPLIGTMAMPTGTLAGMNGAQQLGTWQFGFRDRAAGNTGTVNSFWVEVCSQQIVLSTEAFGFENFALYPNPNNGSFKVQFDTKGQSKVAIAVHDISGRKIFDQSYAPTGLFAQDIQLRHAQAGIYLVSITNGDKKIVKRIVVE